MDLKSAYEELGLALDSPIEEVLEAHQRLARVWEEQVQDAHPRRRQWAEQKLERIQEALRAIQTHSASAPKPPSKPVAQVSPSLPNPTATIPNKLPPAREAAKSIETPSQSIKAAESRNQTSAESEPALSPRVRTKVPASEDAAQPPFETGAPLPQDPSGFARPKTKLPVVLVSIAVLGIILFVVVRQKPSETADSSHPPRAESNKSLPAEENTAAPSADKSDKNGAATIASHEPETPEELFALGDRFSFGRGQQPDYARALQYYERAANKGHAAAQYRLGVMHFQGHGTETNLVKAAQWYRQAAESGLTQAQFALAILHLYGVGAEKNSDLAVKWLRSAAEKGEENAQVTLGWLYLEGDLVARNSAQAFFWIREAVLQNNALAMALIGIMYERGQGVVQDAAEALSWCRKALVSGVNSFDTEGVLQAHRRAGQKIFTQTTLLVAQLYRDGRGVTASMERAVEYWEKAARQGEAEAQFNLGWALHNGSGIQANIEAARQWYEKAAAQNYAPAQFNLGLMYENGLGAPRDLAHAAQWYRKAANLGDIQALVNLGWLLQTQGGETNLTEAIRCYQTAAQKNNSKAQMLLAECYEKGLGVGKDLVEAYKWLYLAAQNNDPDATARLNLLAENLPFADVATALRRAKDWQTDRTASGRISPATETVTP
ncbi:MAG: hypothetical protein AB1813_16825 [Verrucomicrobiota bacterium]